MKNKIKWFGIIALATVIGFGMASCDTGSTEGGSGGDALTGTWTSYNAQAGGEMKLVAANGLFTVYYGEQAAYRGTYTVSGNDVTITFTHVNTGLMSGGGDQWTPFAEVPPGTEGVPPQSTMQGTISGNQLNVDGQTFTKQSGSEGTPTPGPGDAAAGTWINYRNTGSPDKKLTAADGSWIMYDYGRETGAESVFCRGTYTVTGSTVNITVAEVNLGDTAEQWTAYDDIPEQMKTQIPRTIQGTISGNELMLMDGAFIKEGSNPEIGGTFTLTGIPANYIGQYACLRDVDRAHIFGAQSVTPSSQTSPTTATCVQITGSTLILPMWTVSTNAQQTITRYSGNDAWPSVRIHILGQTTITEHDHYFIATISFTSITFSSGSAAKAWSEGTEEP
jgi:hypothetical protein